ncbi:MAG: M48 family metalloprotease [Flavobacteriales bacterium]
MRTSALLLVLLLSACARVPITGRNQLNLLPESEMMAMSFSEYGQFLQQNTPLAVTDTRVAMVRRIGERLSKAATEYLNAHKAGDRIAGFAWEFNVVQSDEVNAWCMPGGKVVVYTGILPLTQDEASLAVVMGHEISHAPSPATGTNA